MGSSSTEITAGPAEDDVVRFLNYFPEMERARRWVDSFFYQLAQLATERFEVPLQLVVPHKDKDHSMVLAFFPKQDIELELRLDNKIAKSYRLTRDGLPSEWVPAIYKKLPMILHEAMQKDSKMKSSVENHWKLYKEITTMK